MPQAELRERNAARDSGVRALAQECLSRRSGIVSATLIRDGTGCRDSGNVPARAARRQGERLFWIKPLILRIILNRKNFRDISRHSATDLRTDLRTDSGGASLRPIRFGWQAT